MSTETEDELGGTMDDGASSGDPERHESLGRNRKNKKKFATKVGCRGCRRVFCWLCLGADDWNAFLSPLFGQVIIRRLPPTMTEEMFIKQIEPLPEHDYFYFVAADWSLGHVATARAYINFVEQEDIFLFRDKWDGYVFVDGKGVEYAALVEFAPFQALLKTKSRKVDNKAGTIEEDPTYIAFLAALANEDADGSKPETKMEYSYQIKDGWWFSMSIY